MSKTSTYNLPIEVIKHISNIASKKIFGKSLTKVDKIIDLRFYDQSEIYRCKQDFEAFMKNAKEKGRTVTAV